MASSSVVQALVARVANLGFLLVGLYAVYSIATWIYNLYFHPLRKYPGPLLAAASPVPYIRAIRSGKPVQWMAALHEKYGQVVRFSPNELSFSSAGAMRDIYGYQKGSPSLKKQEDWYVPPKELKMHTRDIINSDDAGHGRMRRIFSHAFSDRALKLQEPLFLTYVDKLILRLREKEGEKVNMVTMFNYTTFDVMGHLTFGESLNMLDKMGYHPWVASILAALKLGAAIQGLRYYPLLLRTLLRLSTLAPGLHKKREELDGFAKDKVDARINVEEEDAATGGKDGSGVERNDIWGLVLKRSQETGMTRDEMYANAKIFMMAGTETTATLLSGAIYYLLKNPDKMVTLTEEVRGAFPTEDDFSIERLQGLKYLFAVLEESLRLYPPVAFGLPRTVGPAGAVVDGEVVPAGATISAHHYSTYRNPRIFARPLDFVPERWTAAGQAEGAEFENDKRGAMQPFSTGPRNRLGKNLAYHELRIILAKLVYNFDFTLCSESERWSDQGQYVLWDKTPLVVRLRAVR